MLSNCCTCLIIIWALITWLTLNFIIWNNTIVHILPYYSWSTHAAAVNLVRCWSNTATCCGRCPTDYWDRYGGNTKPSTTPQRLHQWVIAPLLWLQSDMCNSLCYFLRVIFQYVSYSWLQLRNSINCWRQILMDTLGKITVSVYQFLRLPFHFLHVIIKIRLINNSYY